jgi:uncharacterized protein (DUF952 family)
MTEKNQAHRTLHLTPAEVWQSQRGGAFYQPEAFEQDGFVHCTDGEERLVMVANMFYQDDPREFFVLTVDLAEVTAQWLYEDDERVFPHIYGAFETSAVVEIRPALRDAAGKFLGFGEPIAG